MVKIEPITPLQSPEPEWTDSEWNLLEWVEDFRSEDFRKSIFEEYFNGDWRSGQEFHKVVITQRLYQTSPNSTQV